MYRFLFVVVSIVLVAGPAHAADDPVQKAMKAYEKHRYEDAARDLRAALPSLDQSKQAPAQLTLGMIYLRSAELHRELAQVSAAVNADYLRRLSAERGAGRSRYSGLYLGLALLESGKIDAAASALEKFLAAGDDAKIQGNREDRDGHGGEPGGRQTEGTGALGRHQRLRSRGEDGACRCVQPCRSAGQGPCPPVR